MIEGAQHGDIAQTVCRRLGGDGLGVGLAGCAVSQERASSTPVGVADSLYWNGPILTMNDAQPQVEAVAVRTGRIVAAGTRVDVARWQGSTT